MSVQYSILAADNDAVFNLSRVRQGFAIEYGKFWSCGEGLRVREDTQSSTESEVSP